MIKINDFLEKPLNRLILWFLTGFIIFLVGIFSVKADSFTPSQITAQLYDNSNGWLSSVNTTFDSSMDIWYGYITHVANSSGGAWGISSPISMLNNHTYSVSAYISVPGCGSTRLSTVDRIGSGISLDSAVSSYQNNSNVQLLTSRVISNSIVQYSFKLSGTNGGYVVIPYATTSSCSNIASHLSGFVIDDLGEGSISEQTINNSLSNQTNIITNSLQSTEQNIIDNQNSNSEAIQESLDEGIKNCYYSSYNNNLLPDSSYWENGDIEVNGLTEIDSNYYIRMNNYIKVSPNTDYYIGFDNNWAYAIIEYSSPNSLTKYNSLKTSTGIFKTSSNTHYIKITARFNPASSGISPSDIDTYRWYLSLNSSISYVKSQGSVSCSSKIDDTNQAINDVNDTLNDDTAPETPDFSDLDVADDSAISDLVTMPITIAEHILEAFNDSCSNYSIPFFNNTTLTLPCFTISDYVGNDVAHVIDLAIILFMIYNIAMLAISVFNDLTSLRDSYDSLYVPQHGPHSYQPRHGKE